MATEADASGDGVEENAEVAPEQEGGGIAYEEGPQSYEAENEEPEDFPHFVEVWNDYDPSQRFAAIFPVGEKEGAVGELGRLLHHRAREAHRASTPTTSRRSCSSPRARARCSRSARRSSSRPGKFVVFPAGADHDIYAQRQRRAAAALVLPDAGDREHVPAGDLPDRRQRRSARSRRAAGRHRARPEQPARGLPVHRSTSSGWPRRAQEPRELTHDRAPDRDDRARDKPPENVEVRRSYSTRRRTPVIEISNPTPKPQEDERGRRGR